MKIVSFIKLMIGLALISLITMSPNLCLAYSSYTASSSIEVSLMSEVFDGIGEIEQYVYIDGAAGIFDQATNAEAPNSATTNGGGDVDLSVVRGQVNSSVSGISLDGPVDSYNWGDGYIYLENMSDFEMYLTFEISWSSLVGASTTGLPGDFAFAETFLDVSDYSGSIFSEYFVHDTDYDGSLTSDAPLMSGTDIFSISLAPGEFNEIYFLADAQGAAFASPETTPPAVPEPSTWLLFCVGGMSMFIMRKHLKN